MGLHAINQGTETNGGGGLPFYLDDRFIFNGLNPGYSSGVGLWPQPNNKVPTFQVHIEESDLVTLEYVGRNADGTPTGLIIDVSSFVTVTPFKKGSPAVQMSAYETSNVPSLAPSAPNGRWILVLKVATAGGELKVFFSEEFVTKPCCG